MTIWESTILTYLKQMDNMLQDTLFSETGNWDELLDVGIALGTLFSLFVVARIAYKSMALEQGIDFLALLRPILIAFVLANWYWIPFTIYSLTKPINHHFQSMYEYQSAKIDSLRGSRSAASMFIKETIEKETVKGELLDNTEKSMALEDEEATEEENEQNNAASEILADTFEPVDTPVDDKSVVAAPVLIKTAWVAQLIEKVVQWIIETIWEVSCCFIFLIRNIYLAVLVIFGPITIAACILPMWHDAWTEWLGRMVSVSLYSGVAYLMMFMCMLIMEYALNVDIDVLEKLGGDPDAFWSFVNFSAKEVGSLLLYIISMLMGIAALQQVPTIATWFIPSSAARSAGDFVGGSLSAVKSTAMGAGRYYITLRREEEEAKKEKEKEEKEKEEEMNDDDEKEEENLPDMENNDDKAINNSPPKHSPKKPLGKGGAVDAAKSGKEWEKIRQRREKLELELEELENAIKGGYIESFLIEKGLDKTDAAHIKEKYHSMMKELDDLERKIKVENKADSEKEKKEREKEKKKYHREEPKESLFSEWEYTQKRRKKLMEELDELERKLKKHE